MASLSQANAESSSHFPGGGGVGCGPQPCRAGGLVLCTCVYLPRAHSVSRLNLLPGRTHLFCILSVFSISNYLCHFFPLWKSCCDYYECSSVKVAGNCLDGCTPAGGHENSWAGGSLCIRHRLQGFIVSPLYSRLLVPPAPSYITYISLSRLFGPLGHSLSLTVQTFSFAFSSVSPLSS
jgi:hypothetical protein